MPYLDRDGARIYYEVHGSGPTVLLTHGFSATSFCWQRQLQPLAQNHQVVVWDIRGHGQSDSPEDPEAYSEALCLDDMGAILDAVGAEQAVIGGHSLGGYLSLAFHVEHPERVAGLMLFNTGPGYRKAEGREGWNRLAASRAVEFEERGLESLQAQPLAHGDQHRGPAGIALAARGILQQFDSRVIDSLPDINVPTLVLVGALDKPFLGATDYMGNKIPDAVKVIIDSAGHHTNLDQTDAFNTAVCNFLDQVK